MIDSVCDDRKMFGKTDISTGFEKAMSPFKVIQSKYDLVSNKGRVIYDNPEDNRRCYRIKKKGTGKNDGYVGYFGCQGGLSEAFSLETDGNVIIDLKPVFGFTPLNDYFVAIPESEGKMHITILECKELKDDTSRGNCLRQCGVEAAFKWLYELEFANYMKAAHNIDVTINYIVILSETFKISKVALDFLKKFDVKY